MASTGATGYIGGDILHALYNKYPDYEYALLVRTQDKGDDIKKQLPNVRIVIADLDNSNVIEEEASKADIVIRMYSVVHCRYVEFNLLANNPAQIQQTLPTTRAQPKQ